MKKEGKKVSIVTGASSGLGREIAKLLSQKGHRTYVVARREKELLELKKECSKNKGEIIVIAGDLTDSKIRENLILRVLKESKRIDYLINNAGFGKAVKFEDQELEDIENMFALNIISTEHMVQLVLPGMKKAKKGRIINLSSGVMFSPQPYFLTYNATKAGIALFTKSLNYELQGTGVSASAVFPYLMKTNFAKVAFDSKNQNKKGAEEYNKNSSSPITVAKNIVKKLDSGGTYIFPTFHAWGVYFLSYFPYVTHLFTKYFMIRKMRKMMSVQKK